MNIQSFLSDPTLIPSLPQASLVRSGTILLDTCNHLILYEKIKNIYDEFKNYKVRSLLLSCRHTYTLPNLVKCPEYHKVLAFASQVGFKEAELTFIQYHQIGGRKYIFIADNHFDDRYKKLANDIFPNVLDRKWAFFNEAICRDPQSERDYLNFVCEFPCSNNNPTWIYGLEGPGRALILITRLFHFSCNVVYAKKEEDSKQSNSAEKTSLTVIKEVVRFLKDINFNAPWDAVIQQAIYTKPFDLKAQALFNDIVAMLKMKLSLKEKEEKLYLELINNHPKIETWKNLFFGLAMTCLKLPTLEFTKEELEVVKKQLAQPKNKDIDDAFEDKIIIAMRDRSFARSLFYSPISFNIVRIAMFGFLHLPGVIRELEQLAASHMKK